MERRALVAHPEVRQVAEPELEALHQPRLADPSIANHEHDAAGAPRRAGPGVGQQRQLAITADHRSKGVFLVPRLEPGLDRSLPNDAEGGLRRDEPLELVPAEVGELEQPPNQAARAVGDDHLAGPGQRLQPVGQVRRLADHRALARLAGADQVAHHDDAGGDPDAAGQSAATGYAQAPDRLGHAKRSPYGTLGLILVRLRPAEIASTPSPMYLATCPLKRAISPATAF